MKKAILSLLLFAGFGLNAIRAQEAKSMEPIMNMGLKLVHEIENKYPNIMAVKSEFDFALDDNYVYVDMVEGLDYIVASLGDQRVEDISLTAYKKVNGKWVELAKDEEKTNYALLEIKPKSTGQYAFDVHVNKFKSSDKIGHVGLMVFAQKDKE